MILWDFFFFRFVKGSFENSNMQEYIEWTGIEIFSFRRSPKILILVQFST